MKILLIHQSFVDHNHPGGTRHYELATSLLRQGHEVTIVAGNLGYLTGEQFVATKSWVAEETLDGIRVLRAYVYPSLHRSFVWRVVSFLSFMVTSFWAGMRSGPVDVVMGTSPPIFQLASTWLVAVLRRRPLLLEIRDLWPEFAIDMGILKAPVLIFLARAMEKFFYNRASHIVVNSPAYRDYLINKRVDRGKITVIPNGVDSKMFDPECTGAAIRNELDLAGRFVVTYAGALGQANDIGTILRAATHLRDAEDVRIVLVGDGKERENLKRHADGLQLDNVLFAGTYPKSRMKEILAASNVCVATLQNIPMFRTTYPNKVFDYMAAGRPTLLAIDGVIRQVMEAAGGGVFVPPGDDVALARAIRSLRDDPGRCRAMGTCARQYVVEHFDRGRHAGELERLLQRLVGVAADREFAKP